MTEKDISSDLIREIKRREMFGEDEIRDYKADIARQTRLPKSAEKPDPLALLELSN